MIRLARFIRYIVSGLPTPSRATTGRRPLTPRTTTQVRLFEQLLDKRTGALLNLTSWTGKPITLKDWLAEQIVTLHILARGESHLWIEQRRFLFLLDGLDETAEHVRSSCIEAINAFRIEFPVPFVVCSRTREYEELQQRAVLRLPYAVEVQPLTAQQVKEHLKRLGRAYACVRAALQRNAILRDLVTTPLLLSIVILTYRDKQVKDLPQLGTPQEQQRLIFEHYVAQRLHLSRSSWHFTAHEMRYWLTMLAQQMQQQHVTELYLERLQSSWFPNQRWGKLFDWSCTLSYGLVMGLVYCFLSGPVIGLLIGVLVGLVFQQGRRDIEPVEVLHWSWEKVRTSKESLYGLVGGLGFGVMGGIVVGLSVGLTYGLIGGVIFGLVFSLIFGLVFGLEMNQFQAHKRLAPNQGIQASGRNALKTGLGMFLGINFIIMLAWTHLRILETSFLYAPRRKATFSAR